MNIVKLNYKIVYLNPQMKKLFYIHINICHSLEQSFRSTFVQFNSSCQQFDIMLCNVGAWAQP